MLCIAVSTPFTRRSLHAGELLEVYWIVDELETLPQVVRSMLAECLTSGDVIVDGGNSNYKDSVRRGALLKEQGIFLVDAGTSGGVWGLTEGYSLMVGGEPEAIELMRPVLESLAPSPGQGWGHVGPVGSGTLSR